MWLCAVSLTRVCRFIVSSHGREGWACLEAAVCTAHSNMQNTCLICCPSHSNPGNSWHGHPLLQMRKLRLKGHEMGRPGCRGWPHSPPPIPPLGPAWTCNSIASSRSPAWPKDPAPWCGADEWGRDTHSCHSPSAPLHFIPDAGRSCRSTASLPTRNKSVQSEAKDLSLSLASRLEDDPA